MAKETGQADYFRNRLEHTVGFTHEATKNIYLVNGAVLAIAAFIASDTFKIDLSDKITWLSFLLFILGIVNIFHALILLFQGYWYRKLDEGYARYSGVSERSDISEMMRPKWLAKLGLGTHRSYFLMHMIIAFSLFASAIYVYFCFDPIGRAAFTKPVTASPMPLHEDKHRIPSR
jgi:hypothetical protein